MELEWMTEDGMVDVIGSVSDEEVDVSVGQLLVN